MTLLSTTIHLSAERRLASLPFLGREAQGWFLKLAAQADPVLADRLHEGSYYRPYTISPLLDSDGPAADVQPGCPYWLRLTSMSRPLTDALAQQLLPGLPGSRLKLGPAEFSVLRVGVDAAEEEWAGHETYETLLNRAVAGQERQLRFTFLTPTAFRHNGRDLPLPEPGLIFRSFLERWNAFAPAPIDFPAADFAREWLNVSHYRLATQRCALSGGNKGWATGFVGQITYSLRPHTPRDRFADQWAFGADVMRILAAFALYCGAGHHTTVGLGQTRLIS